MIAPGLKGSLQWSCRVCIVKSIYKRVKSRWCTLTSYCGSFWWNFLAHRIDSVPEKLSAFHLEFYQPNYHQRELERLRLMSCISIMPFNRRFSNLYALEYRRGNSSNRSMHWFNQEASSWSSPTIGPIERVDFDGRNLVDTGKPEKCSELTSTFYSSLELILIDYKQLITVWSINGGLINGHPENKCTAIKVWPDSSGAQAIGDCSSHTSAARSAYSRYGTQTRAYANAIRLPIRAPIRRSLWPLFIPPNQRERVSEYL